MLIIVKNKKASHNYEILEKKEAGIVLKGSEIKSIRARKVNIEESFIKINYQDEIYIHNMHITNYENSHSFTKVDERRPRKLLMHKKEIIKLKKEVGQKGYSLVPLKVYFNQNHCKVEVGLVKGKKLHDKRQSMREKDIKRQLEKQLKQGRF